MEWVNSLMHFPKKDGVYDTYMVDGNLIIWLKMYFDMEDHKWINALGEDMNMLMVNHRGKFME